MTLVLLQSCEKDSTGDETIIDHLTYGAKFNWLEDSIKVDNGNWKKVANSNVFSWLAQDGNLQSSNFAVYHNRANIKANFFYTIQKDSVFALKLSSGTVYFLDENHNRRADLEGQITFLPDTLLILNNTAVSPAISVKYRLER